MSFNSLFAALLAAVVLVAGLPIPPARAAEPGAASTAPSPVVAAPLPAVSTTDDRFGMVQGIVASDMAYNAGSRWDRIIFPWSLIQKDGPNSWNEQYFTDQAIRAEAARGVDLAGVIIYTPQWASPTPEKGRPQDVPAGLYQPYNDPRNYWGQFVRKLAARQKGVVDNWIIWNEPDMFSPEIRYTFHGSYEDYAQLLKVAYLNIKEVNPNAKVVLAGFAYWWDKEYGRPPYLGPLLEVIGRDPDRLKNNHYFDAVSMHTYGAPLNSFAEPMIAREILDLRGMKKPIWIGESNVIPYNDVNNPLPAGQWRATLDQQAAYVIQSMALAVAANVDRYAIYKATDETPENGIELWGLIRNNGTPKPAYVAYQVATTYFSNVTSAVYTWPGAGDRPTYDQYKAIMSSNDKRPQFIWPSQVSQVVMERGDHLTTVVWNNSPEEVTHRVPANAKQATLVYKNGQTETIKPKDGAYVLTLQPSTHNAEPRDPSIYLIGGEPLIIDEAVRPLPTERVASRIEVVWPLNSAPVNEAAQANVTAQLLMPGTTETVPCRYDPVSDVQLWAWRHERDVEPPPSPTPSPGQGVLAPVPAATPSLIPSPTPRAPKPKKDPEKVLLGTGSKRFATENGVTYPVWDFNGVDISYARNSTPTQEYSLELFVVVDTVKTDPTPWFYGGEKNQDWTQPRVRPSGGCQ
ncbi:MAG: hypothetical protein IT305_15485 [Chloroflexi bacterium]|nr:hypothetical protein [Chloroflexota bacterium]